jgi:hypothetical protein
MKNKGKKCKISSCNDDAVCKEYCSKHYQQIKLRGSIIEKDYVFIENLCKIIGCSGKEFSKGFCQKHYIQNKKDELCK